MCGINGRYNFTNSPVSKAALEKMNTCQAHRGPDTSGTFISESKAAGLGHTRLAIIDLSSAGAQPMVTKQHNKNIALSFNGEIYNFQSLRAELKSRDYTFTSDTDTEVVLKLYSEYGADFLSMIDGMFALAIWDGRTEEMLLARDRLGQKPLKYYRDENTLIFASEISSIFQHEVTPEIDHSAIDEYLSLKYVAAPKTGFKHVKKLEPAHYLRITKDGQVQTKRYWSYEYSPNTSLTKSEWKTQIADQLHSAVKKRLMSDVPLGVHLSGGVDSSLVTALASQHTTGKLKTFSIGFKESQSDEREYARAVADRYSTDHHEHVVTPSLEAVLDDLITAYGEPYADSSALPTWYLSKMTKKDVTVALNGDGADEAFGGYRRHQSMLFISRFWPLLQLAKKAGAKKILNAIHPQNGPLKRMRTLFHILKSSPDETYRNLFANFTGDEKHRLYSNELQETVSNSRIGSLFSKHFQKDISSLSKILSADTHIYLPDDLLTKVDIASMAHSLEVRSPFLDHHVIELAATLPDTYKSDTKKGKKLLKEIARDYVPGKCIDRKKSGFGIPAAQWFRNEKKDFIKKELTEDSTLAEFGMNQKELKRLVATHQSGTEDNADRLWTLLMLKRWLDHWF